MPRSGPEYSEAWRHVGRLSTIFGQTSEAIYCYSRAISANPTDVDALWDRSFIYFQQQNYEGAIKGYKRILAVEPWNLYVLLELTKLLLPLNRTEECLKLWDNIFEEDQHRDIVRSKKERTPLSSTPMPAPGQFSDQENEQEEEDGVILGYEELAIYSEICFKVGVNGKCIRILKEGTLRLLGLSWTSSIEDDSHFNTVLKDNQEHLPLNIRVRLGICRLLNAQTDDAKEHFKYLFSKLNSVLEHTDLYYQIADAYIQKTIYMQAITVLDVCTKLEPVRFRYSIKVFTVA